MERIKDTSSIKKGDYLKVISNQPAYHLCTCYGGLDVEKEDIKAEELICIVNSVIDEKTLYVTTLLPHEGSNFVADISEIIGKLSPESLPEKTRDFKCIYPGYVYSPSESVGADPEEMAAMAIQAIFPDKEIGCIVVKERGYFSMDALLDNIEYALDIVDRESERYPYLREKGASLAGWVSRQRFKRYDEVIAGVDDYRWLIAVARDRSEVIICPDINERTRFARSLGPEYLEAERAVSRFRDECLEGM